MTYRRNVHRRRGNVKMEAEIGAMWLQTQEGWGSYLERGKDWASPRVSRGRSAQLNLDFGLLVSRTVLEYCFKLAGLWSQPLLFSSLSHVQLFATP